MEKRDSENGLNRYSGHMVHLPSIKHVLWTL